MQGNSNFRSDFKTDTIADSFAVAMLEIFVRYWFWFLISTLFCIVTGAIFLHYATPRYNISGSILIRDDSRGTDFGESAMLNDLGFSSVQSNVENENEILKSRQLMGSIVDDLQLCVRYFEMYNFRTVELYEKAPYRLKVLDTLVVSFPDKLTIHNFSKNKILLQSKSKTWDVHFGDTLTLSGCRAIVEKTAVEADPKTRYFIILDNRERLINELLSSWKVLANNKMASLVTLSFTDELPVRGVQIVSALIRNYQHANVQNQTARAEKTLRFLDDNLGLIKSRLDTAESDIEAFKTKHQDLEWQSGASAMQSFEAYMKERNLYHAQLSHIDLLQRIIAGSQELIPMSAQQFSDPVYVTLIKQYNDLLQDRQRQASNLQLAHPALQQINVQTDMVRSELLANLHGQEMEITAQFRQINTQIEEIWKAKRNAPSAERKLQTLVRQQQISQELYATLLKKRLETAMTQFSTVSNAWVVDKPIADSRPVYPNRAVVLLMSGLFGAGLPFACIHLRKTINRDVQSRNDVADAVSAPIIGEVVHCRKPFVFTTNRSQLAEQFGIIRTNLQLSLPASKKIILITSGNAGEGKSFVALRLAQTFANADKKTILLELDLRKPSIAGHLGIVNAGMSEFLASDHASHHFIQTPQPGGFDVIPAGHAPPDPLICLSSSKFADFITGLRTTYDQIIIDSPPVGLVADARLIGQFADLTIYVIREGVTAKKHLQDLQQHIVSNHLPAMHLVLNDTKNSNGYDDSYYTPKKSGFHSWFQKL